MFFRIRSLIINVNFETASEGKANIRIVDMLGQVVKAEMVEFAGGENREEINMDGRLADGMYFMEFQTGDKLQYVKLYKSK